MPNTQESKKLYQLSILAFLLYRKIYFLNNNIKKVDHIIITIEIKEEYNIYFIKFKEVNGT